jgi:riboflavin synthase
MFTGIIEGLGTIYAVQPSGEGKKLTIDADFVPEGAKKGDSISVSGACLTAVVINGARFTVDVSPETLARSTFAQVKTGDRVNIERAMRLSDRLDGHLVSGHIDGVGTIIDRKIKSNAILITIGAPESLCRFMIEKGSVAVDGISLTINGCTLNSFEVSIIPYTSKLTTIGFKNIGAHVNIETDMIGKYIEKFLSGRQTGDQHSGKSDISMDLLAKAGFLTTQY